MAKVQRQPFTPSGPFVVSQPFRWAGRDYKLGEEFVASRLAVNARRTRQLWDQRKIDVPSSELPDADNLFEEETSSQELTAGEGEFLFDPEIHMIDREGTEYWIADEDSLLVRVRADMGKLLDKSQEKVVVPADKILEWPTASDGESS